MDKKKQKTSGSISNSPGITTPDTSHSPPKSYRVETTHKARTDAYNSYLEDKKAEEAKKTFSYRNNNGYSSSMYFSQERNAETTKKGTIKLGDASHIKETRFDIPPRSFQQENISNNATPKQETSNTNPSPKIKGTTFHSYINNQTETQKSSGTDNSNSKTQEYYGVNRTEILNDLNAQVNAEQRYQKLHGMTNHFKSLYPTVARIGVQLSGVDQMHETDAYQGYKKIRDGSEYAVYAMVVSGAIQQGVRHTQKNVSEHLIATGDDYRKGMDVLKDNNIRTTQEDVNIVSQRSMNKFHKEIKQYGLANNLGDLTKMRTTDLNNLLRQSVYNNRLGDLSKYSEADFQKILSDETLAKGNISAIKMVIAGNNNTEAQGFVRLKVLDNKSAINVNVHDLKSVNSALQQISKIYTNRNLKDYTKLSIDELQSLLKSDDITELTKQSISDIIALRTIRNGKISELENSINITDMSVDELRFMLTDSSLSSEDIAVVKIAADFKDINALSNKTILNTLKRAGISTDKLVIDVNNYDSLKAALQCISKSLKAQGLPDYTQYSVKQLRKLLDSGTLSAEHIDLIKGVIIPAKGRLKFIRREGLANSKKGLSKIKMLQKLLNDSDAFQGAMLVYRSITAVKSALILANTLKQMAGRILVKGAKGIYKHSGAEKLTKVVASHRTLTPEQIEKKAQKATQKAKKQERKQEKLRSKASRKPSAKIKNSKLYTTLSQKWQNSAAGKLFAKANQFIEKLLSPFKFVQRAFSSINAFVLKTVLAFGGFLLVLVLGITVLTSAMSAISTWVVYSESADLKIDENGNTVEATNIEDSMFYKLIAELSQKDSDWTSKIEQIESDSPSDVAAEYGINGGAPIYGYYNPNTNSKYQIEHWGEEIVESDGTVTRNGYYTMYFDGRGIGDTHNSIAKYQNLKMCIALAHVFVGYDYDTYDDTDENGNAVTRNQLKIFEEYAKALWSSSHKIEPKISDVYDCDSGCADYNYKCNENKAYNLNTSDPAQNNYVCLKGSLVPYNSNGCVMKTHSHSSPVYNEKSKYEPDKTGTEGEIVTQKTTVTYFDKQYNTTIKYNTACNDYTIKTYTEHTSSSSCSNLITIKCDGSCPGATNISHGVSTGKPAAGCDNYLVQRIDEVHSEADVAFGDCPNPNPDGTCPGHSRVEYVCLSHNICPGHKVCGGHAVCNGHHYCSGHEVKICLGHVDVDVESMIVGITNPEILDGTGEVLVIQDTSLFKEGLVSDDFKVHNGLFVYDYEKVKEKVGFEGWTEENIELALEFYNADWYELYGIEFAGVQGAPLGSGEINNILETINVDPTQMSEGEAQNRQKIVSWALESVGKIPYYWGGTASGPGYDGNNFGSIVGPDYKGRTAKGLDCSHWVDWVYWSTMEDNLGNGSTHTLCSSSKLQPITRSSLKPGDILLLNPTGSNAHAGIFIKWNDDGTMMYIDERGSPANNVVIGNGATTWTHFYTYKNIDK